ncbi:MAG: hypothetical protein ACE5K1_05255 [Acidiferrobacterales bacterium]
MKYRYPFEHLAGDYLRAVIGFTLMLAVVLFASLPQIVILIFAALAAVFLGFGIQTALRHHTQISVTDEDISAAPRGVRLRWSELTAVELDYYSTTKDKRDGWMQLTLRSRQKKLQIDSRIEGFEDISRRAGTAALNNGLTLNPTSVANFATFGIGASAGPNEKGTGRHG